MRDQKTILERLRPCPFCGGPGLPRFWEHDGMDGNVRVFFIGCERCTAEGPEAFTYMEAAAAWNRRARDVMRDASALIDKFRTPEAAEERTA